MMAKAQGVITEENTIKFSIGTNVIRIDRGFDVQFKPCIETSFNGLGYDRTRITEKNRDDIALLWENLKAKAFNEKSKKVEDQRVKMVNFMDNF